MLVERGGDIVTREEIQQKLWPNDTAVDFDQGINKAIRKLRQVLGDSAEKPTYIETVARRGYRLLQSVERLQAEDSSDPALSPEAGKSTEHPGGAASLIGEKVSHYRVLEVLGGGGMGMVYKAEDLKLGRCVALKFLPSELANDFVTLQRFEREAQTASSLNHPNICTIHEIEEYKEQPFIVMELLEGKTLRDLLAANESKGLPRDQLLDIAIQIGDGLQAAHEKGIIHRDIKPANIFITNKGVCKILDFGLAKLLEMGDSKDPKAAASDEVDRDLKEHAFRRAVPDSPPFTSGLQPATGMNLTHTGSAMGTAGYMSPEQVRGETLDARTDVFSFGLVLYEMATGKRAFSADTAAVVQDAILNQTPAPAHEVNSTIPPKLEQIVNRAIEKDREQRYQSAAEMRADFNGLQADLQKNSTQRPLLRIATLLLLVAAVIGLVLYWQMYRRVRLTETDQIVLADFANNTGDQLFDGTLKQALSLHLQQSPFLNLVSDQKVNETLKLMDRAPGQKLTETTAKEVCLRTHSKALLAGAISSRGERYRIEMKVLDCQTGDTLTSAAAEAENRNEVIGAVGELGNQLRRRMGESLASVEKYNQPLAEATTSSLEALQAFTQAQTKEALQGNAAALPYYKLAVELDPTFGYAWARLGFAYGQLSQDTAATASFKKAFELRDRVSQRERFFIEGQYYDYVTGDLDKFVETYSHWTQVYPREYMPHMRLSSSYRAQGNLEEALAESKVARQIAPDNVAPATSLMLAYFRLNRFKEAKAVYDETRARKLDGATLRLVRCWVAFFEDDERGMQEQLGEAMGRPGVEDQLLFCAADTAGYRGHLQAARDWSDQAVASAQRADAPERAALWETFQAQREVFVGNPRLALADVERALALSTGDDVKAKAALALALIGESARAQALAGQFNPQPTGTLMHKFVIPIIQGAIYLQQGHPQKAIETLNVALPYELGGAAQCCLTPAYLRGLAYLQLGQGTQAAAEFQKLLDHPGVVTNNQQGSLAHLQLARAQAMSGDKAAARKSYQDFLTLWRDADPDIPIYQQAKTEYAKLQ
jgi:serine/threonine protein kinase/Flp pilus assembly protein TadD